MKEVKIQTKRIYKRKECEEVISEKFEPEVRKK